MNLNFYNPSHATSLEGLQNSLQEQIARLNELKSVQIQGMNPPKVRQPLQEQRYYLDCGNKQDWVEFLRINYNLTETQIFDDYKLFLQAKAELNEDNNKEKLEAMKQKLAPNRKEEQHIMQAVNNDSNNMKQNVSPQVVPQQPIQQPVGNINAGNNTAISNTNINQTNNNKLATNTNYNENKGVKYAR